MREKGLIIGGYLFSNNKDYNSAKEEYESIHILRSKADLTDPGTVLKLYNKLIENRTFHTIIGYTFLKELQVVVLSSGIVKEEDIDGIYIPVQNANNIDISDFEKYKQLTEKQKNLIRNKRIINIFLLITILGMLIIAIYTNKSVYADFENKIINRYSAWEEELNNREEDLIQREEALEGINTFE
ncbi:hypothetical protein [Anaerocolumna sp. MB42-C2]|uniref:hypothetical protein n=1 Tax=Anaerocolumna sp. MB42-C2 TaxID=3070997 RepID=UPI0027DFFD32|nr:hypothetical protein [Anaerocolumna sp. MB42-C2]WMJ87717.1 hypothetical protein RBU59_27410 [Anaerocolumna sp. MB42-C2]